MPANPPAYSWAFLRHTSKTPPAACLLANPAAAVHTSLETARSSSAAKSTTDKSLARLSVPPSAATDSIAARLENPSAPRPGANQFALLAVIAAPHAGPLPVMPAALHG